MTTLDPNRTRPHRQRPLLSGGRSHYVERLTAERPRFGTGILDAIFWAILGAIALLVGRRGQRPNLMRWGCTAVVALILLVGIAGFVIYQFANR
jgi:hypothetical protein